ncbi:MAG: hypothetical protein Q7V63_01515 [Gammaproteobacteria bacterium]|nr:hypothetical protein [Gammaproteobacteria bacterium]
MYQLSAFDVSIRSEVISLVDVLILLGAKPNSLLEISKTCTVSVGLINKLQLKTTIKNAAFIRRYHALTFYKDNRDKKGYLLQSTAEKVNYIRSTPEEKILIKLNQLNSEDAILIHVDTDVSLLEQAITIMNYFESKQPSQAKEWWDLIEPYQRGSDPDSTPANPTID